MVQVAERRAAPPVLDEKRAFLKKSGRFLAKNEVKIGVCSYYLINRVKSYVVDCLVVS
jgi:hypothetical protein